MTSIEELEGKLTALREIVKAAKSGALASPILKIIGDEGRLEEVRVGCSLKDAGDAAAYEAEAYLARAAEEMLGSIVARAIEMAAADVSLVEALELP